MKKKSGFKWRLLLSGCALAMGIGASSSAMAMPKDCYDRCYELCDYSSTLCELCAYGCMVGSG